MNAIVRGIECGAGFRPTKGVIAAFSEPFFGVNVSLAVFLRYNPIGGDSAFAEKFVLDGGRRLLPGCQAIRPPCAAIARGHRGRFAIHRAICCD